MSKKEQVLREMMGSITPANENARCAAHERWASCAKPLGGLGLLETMIEDMAALTGTADVHLEKRTLLVLCADNGVVAEGVSQTDSEVTAVVARQLGAGQSTACRMAAIADCKVVAVDMGILNPPPLPGVLNARVANGTGNIARGPAMTREQAAEAVWNGMVLVRLQKKAGVQMLAAGEMGIGNTTTATAVTCALLGLDPADVTGRGAGLSDAGLQRKIQAIRQALAVNAPDAADPLDVLCKVGGLDIAGLCGLFLGGALYGVPVLMDGVITAAAALCAAKLCPASDKAIFASHCSAEPCSKRLLDALHKKPLITAGLHLGEGTGALAAIPLLDMALAVYGGSTFADYGMQAYTPQGGSSC